MGLGGLYRNGGFVGQGCSDPYSGYGSIMWVEDCPQKGRGLGDSPWQGTQAPSIQEVMGNQQLPPAGPVLGYSMSIP